MPMAKTGDDELPNNCRLAFGEVQMPQIQINGAQHNIDADTQMPLPWVIMTCSLYQALQQSATPSSRPQGSAFVRCPSIPRN